jgi:hypothetical protein
VHDRANDGAGELDPVITVTSEAPVVAVAPATRDAPKPTVATRPVDDHHDADRDADD